MTLVTSIINFKGGVAKTTTTINLAAGLTKLKERVLVIDTDPQGNVATNLLGSKDNFIDPNEITISKLYKSSKIDPNKAIKKTPYFDYIPNNLYSYQLTNGLSDYRLLKQIIEKVKGKYDHILIDTPPYLGFDSFNAIAASDNILLVTDFSRGSLSGIEILVTVLNNFHDKSIANTFQKKPKSILFTMFQGNANLHKQLLKNLEDSKAMDMGIVLKERIPRQLKVVEDGYSGVPTVNANPKSKVAIEYKKLADTWQYARQAGVIIGTNHTINVK